MIGNLLKQQIEIHKKTEKDMYGDASYAEGIETWCRMQSKKKTLLRPDGKVIVYDAVCFVDKDTDVAEKDKIVYEENAYIVEEVYKAFANKGVPSHIELKLSRLK